MHNISSIRLLELQVKKLNLNRCANVRVLSTDKKNDNNNNNNANRKVDATEEKNLVDGFRVFEAFKKSSRTAFVRRPFIDRLTAIERYKRMSTEQDWTNVWPASSTFKQSAVPLPIHQGHIKNRAENGGLAPAKYANAELMKIPNFLHLTPPHIKKHCEAMKKFCTPWPKELETNDDCNKYFPIEIKTTDYLYAGPSIRDERSRIVTLQIKISNLQLNEHAREKLIKLAEDRYDPKTDLLTITSAKCPLRKQNLEYVKYLLTALYFESWKVEEWESEITEDDWLKYDWENSKSKEVITKFVDKLENEKIEADFLKNYGKVVENVFNKGETKNNINAYKESVLQLFGLDKLNVNANKNTQVEEKRIV